MFGQRGFSGGQEGGGANLIVLSHCPCRFKPTSTRGVIKAGEEPKQGLYGGTQYPVKEVILLNNTTTG